MVMVQLMPLHPKTPSSLASFKSRLVLPFWCHFTQVVLERQPFMGVVVVVVVITLRDIYCNALALGYTSGD